MTDTPGDGPPEPSDPFDPGSVPPAPGDGPEVPPADGAVPPPLDDRPAAAPPPPPPEGPSPATVWLLAGILGALAILIVLFVFFLTRDEDEPVAADLSTTTTEEAATTTEAETTTSTSEETTTTTEAETTTTTEETTTTTTEATTTTAPVVAASPQDAALRWINAINAGDVDTAWALLAPSSQDAVGGFAGFEGLFTGLSEGFGAWATASPRTVYTNEVRLVGVADLWVVTFEGRVTQEGSTTDSAAAIPVSGSGSGPYLVRPFERGELLQFDAPPFSDPPAAFPADGTFEVVVPDTPTVQLFVDDTLRLDPAVEATGGGNARATATPDSPLSGGRHALTVLYVDQGQVHAEALAFDV